MKWSWVFNCSLDYSLYFPDWKFLLIKRTEERKYFHAVLFYYVPISIPQVGKPHSIVPQEMVDGNLDVYLLFTVWRNKEFYLDVVVVCFLKSAVDRQQKCLGRRNNHFHFGFKGVNIMCVDWWYNGKEGPWFWAVLQLLQRKVEVI